ncbi:MAG: CoA transferase, partial [Actinobacteria bacterium]|nr:CoA transferase [Actinomycetota bacterium]NIU65861.1 CoA transferase [Actinomycetota bacterium]NIW27656.1 CoA transferase [Actinomycetota bacterium]NIX20174.1 CoA transferase [Actinomycetota bacterium]
IDRPELAEDQRFETNPDRVEHLDELEAELTATFEQRSTAEWVELLAEEHDLPVGPVLTVPEALENEQTEARGVVSELEHSAAGTIPAIEHPLNFDGAESGFAKAPPLLGEDTEAVLRAAGYDDAAISSLKEAGAIPDRD